MVLRISTLFLVIISIISCNNDIVKEEKQNEVQLNRFKEMVATVESFGYTNIVRHLSNSAATLKDQESRFDMVRVGIAMYGLSPDVKTLGDSASLGLKPAMQLRAKLHLVKTVPANSPVGYGATAYTTAEKTGSCCNGICRWNSANCTRCRRLY